MPPGCSSMLSRTVSNGLALFSVESLDADESCVVALQGFNVENQALALFDSLTRVAINFEVEKHQELSFQITGLYSSFPSVMY